MKVNTTWKTTSAQTVESNHPPQEEVIIITQQGVEVIASPYKTIGSHESEERITKLRDIRSLQQQNNYTNKNLSTISDQLDRIEDKLVNNTIIKPVQYNELNRSTSFLNKNIDSSQPLFRINRETILKLESRYEGILNILAEKFKTLELEAKASTSKSVNIIDEEEDLEDLEQNFQFKQQEEPVVNGIAHPLGNKPTTRNFYPRPPDIQFEETHLMTSTSYDGQAST